MRIQKIFCDRCGKEFEAINNAQLSTQSARLDLYTIGQPRTCPSQRLDFCAECFDKFVTFLEESN